VEEGIKVAFICFIFYIVFSIIGLPFTKPHYSSCISCHAAIESVSKNHNFDCTDCHGGDKNSENKKEAHKSMLCGKNPSDMKCSEKVCGKCHYYEWRRVETTIMNTNTGIINNLLAAWGESDNKTYSTSSLQGHDEFGAEIKLFSILENDNFATIAYRKFCSSCHIGYNKWWGYNAHHSSGCAACHWLHSESGVYEGQDASIKHIRGYASEHKISSLPENAVCFKCHNRSGRISLHYEGLVDANNSLIPTNGVYPGRTLISELRNVYHIKGDIHFTKYKLDCIDCHTSRDIMGDGYIYKNMYKQVEISCEDCHGGPTSKPKFGIITKENDGALIESQNYINKNHYNQKLLKTKKNRFYSNAYFENGNYYLVTKRQGKKYKLSIITGDRVHNIFGHESLDCVSCHSRVVQQCYGCHTIYDERLRQFDVIKGEMTEGGFYEKEDLRRLYPFPLALNEKGKIGPITPGCQTFLTYIDKNGGVKFKDKIPTFRGKRQFKYVSFYSHNTGEKAVSCVECHGDLYFAGFGNALVSIRKKKIISPILCDTCDKPLDAIVYIRDNMFYSTGSMVRENSRTLNKKELLSLIKVNSCLLCHNKGDERLYEKNIDYGRINKCLLLFNNK
jgi:hypothetical protein